MELLPCPFCASNDILLTIQPTPHETIYYITCVKCNISTHVFINKESLIEYWNTRHSPQKEWCPFATMELIKCQKALNDLQDKYNNLLKSSPQWIFHR